MSDLNIDISIYYGRTERMFSISTEKSYWFVFEKSPYFKTISVFNANKESDEGIAHKHFCCFDYHQMLATLVLMKHFFKNFYRVNEEFMLFLDMVILALDYYPFNGIIEPYETTPLKFSGAITMYIG